MFQLKSLNPFDNEKNLILSSRDLILCMQPGKKYSKVKEMLMDDLKQNIIENMKKVYSVIKRSK